MEQKYLIYSKLAEEYYLAPCEGTTDNRNFAYRYALEELKRIGKIVGTKRVRKS